MEQNQKRTATTDIVFSRNVFKDFKRYCSILNSGNYFTIKENLYKKQIWNSHYLLKGLDLNEANAAILKLAFETVCNYEKRWAGSGLAFLRTVNEPNFRINKHRIRCSSRVLIESIQKNLSCEVTKNVFSQIKNYGNPQLSISVSREPIDKPIIKFVSTPSVRLRVHESFNLKDSVHKNCKFFMVNGAVSSASEITKLLNESFENKNSTYFLVCKSFNDEVIYTLKENYDRSLTNIIPVQFGFDLDSINSLPDLHSVVGGLPFSSDLGDVLSAADFSRFGFSEKVNISNNRFVIKPSADNRKHILNLIKKIEKTNNDSDERKILSRRAVALKGNSCNILLPKNPKFNSVETNIRHASLMLHQMSKFGVSEIKINKSKFYIPSKSSTMIPELSSRIEDLFKTKIYLPRR